MSESGDRPEEPAGAAEPGAQGPNGTGPTADERQWGLIVHLSALAGFVIPFGNIIGPLIIWQIKKGEMPFVDDQGKEALNFQITVSIAVLVCLVLFVIFIGVLLLPIVGLVALVLTVIAAVKANGGERYRYPMTLRLVN